MATILVVGEQANGHLKKATLSADRKSVFLEIIFPSLL